MKTLIGAEVRKLLSTRSIVWLTLGAVAMTLMSVGGLGGQSAQEFAEPLNEQQFFFLATFTKILIVVIGIRIITDEYRFGTILPTFTFTPQRVRVLRAKILVAGVAGLAVAALVQAVLLGAAALVYSVNGHSLHLGGEGPRAIAGAIAAGGAWAVIGLGVGALLRNQIAAIVGSLVWLMALEEMLRGVIGDAADVLPGSAGFGLALGLDGRAMVLAGLTLLGWAVALSAAGSFVLRRADVT